MRHKAKLNISRPSYGDDRKKIKISVEDVGSRIEFLEIEIDPDKFAECLTGLSFVGCDMEVRDLEHVGKKRETMEIVFEIPEPHWNIGKNVVAKLAEEVTPEGWEVSTYFGSKDSFFSRDGKEFARTTAYKWVEK